MLMTTANKRLLLGGFAFVGIAAFAITYVLNHHQYHHQGVNGNELPRAPSMTKYHGALERIFGSSASVACDGKVPENITVPFINCSSPQPITGIVMWCQDCFLPETCCSSAEAPTNPKCVGLPGNCDTTECCGGCYHECAGNTPEKNLNCWACSKCCYS